MEAFLDGRDTGVEVNTKIIKYMFLSPEWNGGQNHNFKIAKKKVFENLVKFKYSGMTLAYENCLHEEIKRKFRKCLLPFSPESFTSGFLSRNMRIRVNRAVCPVILLWV